MMFRRNVQSLDEILMKLLRDEGLETPLQQKRLIDSWETIAGPLVARYTGEKYIKNQTLCVKINNPALRQDLTMMRSKLIKQLNTRAGAWLISEIRLY